jgi:hypothetical protein
MVFENEDQTQRIEFVLGPLGDCQTLEDVTVLLKANYPDMTVTPTRINEYSTLVFGNEEKDSMTLDRIPTDQHSCRYIQKQPSRN